MSMQYVIACNKCIHIDAQQMVFFIQTFQLCCSGLAWDPFCTDLFAYQCSFYDLINRIYIAFLIRIIVPNSLSICLVLHFKICSANSVEWFKTVKSLFTYAITSLLFLWKIIS